MRATFTEGGDNNDEAIPVIYKNYYPFGWEVPGAKKPEDDFYRFAYQGQFAEKDEETGFTQFEARLFDSRIGRWMSPDPIKNFWSPYIGMGNNPILFGDADGRDIIIMTDSEAAFTFGHASVIIGNQQDGWQYFSMNGTGTGSRPFGISKNADLGGVILGKGLTAEQIIQKVNTINPKEVHHYDTYRIIKSTPKEDIIAADAARIQAGKERYNVFSQSCIDVPKAAIMALLKHRGVDEDFTGGIYGFTVIEPNNWINKLDQYIEAINESHSTVTWYNVVKGTDIIWNLGASKTGVTKEIITVGPLERVSPPKKD